MTDSTNYDVLVLAIAGDEERLGNYLVLTVNVPHDETVTRCINVAVQKERERVRMAGVKLQLVRIGPAGAFDEYIGRALSGHEIKRGQRG